MLNKCENCGGISIKGKEIFHNNFDCPSNTLTFEEWKHIDSVRKDKIVNNIIQEFKYENEVKSLSFKQLGDYIIEHIWSHEKWGGKNAAVLDRVINILFSLQEKKDGVNLQGMGVGESQ